MLESRLAELGAEERKLTEALKQLAGGSGRKDGKAAARKPGRRPSRRAGRGQRREELLAVIKSKPGAPVSEIAGEMGVSPGQAYGLVSKARKDKLIVKKGKGFAVK